MKLFAYLKYFFFLGVNWNFRIATVLILEEIKGEKKYGISTIGADNLKLLKKQGLDTSHATIYMPVCYSILQEIFIKLPLTTRTHFLDIGCGKGRALAAASVYGFKKVTGIDFSKVFCNEAEKNLKNIRAKGAVCNFEIINEDAKSAIIEQDIDCIFLFNPFDETIMILVVKNILKSFYQNKRTIIVTYVNPLYKNIFLQNGFEETHYSKRMHYLELSILKIG